MIKRNKVTELLWPSSTLSPGRGGPKTRRLSGTFYIQRINDPLLFIYHWHTHTQFTVKMIWAPRASITTRVYKSERRWWKETGELETEADTRWLKQWGAATDPPVPAPSHYNVTQCHDLLQINKKMICGQQQHEMFTESLSLPKSCLEALIYLKFSVFQMFGLLSRSEKFRKSH